MTTTIQVPLHNLYLVVDMYHQVYAHNRNVRFAFEHVENEYRKVPIDKAALLYWMKRVVAHAVGIFDYNYSILNEMHIAALKAKEGV